MENTFVYSNNTLKKAHSGDAAYDLIYTGQDDVELKMLERHLCETNVNKISIPVGKVGMVAPRSGLAIKHGITVLNAPGIIDSGYRDMVKVVLVNMSSETFVIKPGMRIAQLLIVELSDDIQEAPLDSDVFDEIDERDGGFGSSGI